MNAPKVGEKYFNRGCLFVVLRIEPPVTGDYRGDSITVQVCRYYSNVEGVLCTSWLTTIGLYEWEAEMADAVRVVENQ